MAKYAKKLWDNLETEYSEVIYFKESFLNLSILLFLLRAKIETFLFLAKSALSTIQSFSYKNNSYYVSAISFDNPKILKYFYIIRLINNLNYIYNNMPKMLIISINNILYISISSILLSEYTSNLLIFVCNIFIMSVIFVVLKLNCNYIR